MDKEHKAKQEELERILDEHFEKLFSKFFQHCLYNFPDKLGLFTSAFEIDHQPIALRAIKREIKKIEESLSTKV